MTKLRGKKPEKVRANPPSLPKHFIFSFKYLQTRGHCSFEYFKKDIRAKTEAHEAFIQILHKMSQKTIDDIIGERKANGFEMMPLSSFKSKYQEILLNTGIVSRDSKLIVIRFNSGRYRIIGKMDASAQNVIHVILFDFDFSAYDHG